MHHALCVYHLFSFVVCDRLSKCGQKSCPDEHTVPCHAVPDTLITENLRSQTATCSRFTPARQPAKATSEKKRHDAETLQKLTNSAWCATPPNLNQPPANVRHFSHQRHQAPIVLPTSHTHKVMEKLASHPSWRNSLRRPMGGFYPCKFGVAGPQSVLLSASCL